MEEAGHTITADQRSPQQVQLSELVETMTMEIDTRFVSRDLHSTALYPHPFSTPSISPDLRQSCAAMFGGVLQEAFDMVLP